MMVVYLFVLMCVKTQNWQKNSRFTVSAFCSLHFVNISRCFNIQEIVILFFRMTQRIKLKIQKIQKNNATAVS